MRRVAELQRWWQRVLASLALLLVVLVVLGGIAPLVGLLDGYGDSQSSRAAELARRTPRELARLRRQTVRDMALYVPAYLLVGGAFVWVVVGPRRRRAVALGLLGAGGAADLIETALFRRTLTRLLRGVDPSVVDRATRITAAFTGIKFTALIAAGVAVIVFGALPEHRPVSGG